MLLKKFMVFFCDYRQVVNLDFFMSNEPFKTRVGPSHVILIISDVLKKRLFFAIESMFLLAKWLTVQGSRFRV
jgi:hypothetical protein